MGVFWNLGWMELQVDSIYCVYLKYAYNMMRCLYNRFRFPAVPVTKVRQTLLRCVDRRENTSERREKEVQVSLDLPNAACVLLLVRYDWTRSGRRNLVVRNVVWNPVMRVNVPHASVHALGLALIVTSAISEPARVIAVKSALILRRQATAPLAISAIRSAAVLAIIAVVIRIIVTITVSVLIDAIAVLVPIPIAVSIPIAILIAMVLIITVVAAMITIAAAVIIVLISFGLIITVLRGGRSY